MSLIENLLPQRFEIIGELGRGGSSVVFHARDTQRDQEVAVKVLLREGEEDRFQREAERLAGLSHPNVVSFLEVGHHEGRDFLVMEYLEMGDLTTYIKNHSVVQILRLFSQICDGLAHLHDRGIVHRDIKPANILVNRAGRPKITDLGVARHVERNTRLTQAGTILGTYSYLAPEQILSSTVGPRADIYSLGICLFTSLTGRKPFEADNEFKMLKAHLEETPPSIREFLPEAPESLDALVQQMLAKDEEDRPRSARAVADMLQECIRDLENQNREDLQPVWEEKIEGLPEDQRSVLLAITYLKDDATFENVCQATPFSEDKTDRCLEALLQDRLIDSPTDDRFSLRFPEETIQTRLTPRLKKLFASRLAVLSDSRDQSLQRGSTTLEPPPQVAYESAAIDLLEVEENAAKADPGATTVDPREEVTVIGNHTLFIKEEETVSEPEVAPPPTPPEPKRSVPVEKPKAEKAASVASKPRWVLISVCMMLMGILLAGAGQWYWAHSASLVISTNPEGAKVEVNGHEMGVTPIVVEQLRPGIQAVDVVLEGHREVNDRIELGFMQKQEAHYTLDARVGKLLLTLKPRDASVKIDDQVYGVINSDLILASGKHQLEVTKDGFQDYRSELSISEDSPLEVEVKLAPIVANIEVTSVPKGADVTLDGDNKGKTPLTLENVPFGTHEVAVRLKGHDRVNRTVEVKSSDAVKVEAELTELPGALVVTSEPSGAKLKLNGEVKGNTPQTISGLKAGEYSLSLSKDGYNVVQEKKAVVAGEESKAHYALRLKVVARPVPPPPSRPYTPPPTYQPPPYRPPPPSRPPPGGQPWIIE
jgi:serine/threonine protein kinase